MGEDKLVLKVRNNSNDLGFILNLERQIKSSSNLFKLHNPSGREGKFHVLRYSGRKASSPWAMSGALQQQQETTSRERRGTVAS